MQTRPVRWMAVWIAAVLCSLPAMAQETLELRPGVGRAGIGFYTVDQWGLIRSSVINHDQVERTPLLVLSSRLSENVQFAKRLWLPPRSRLTAFTPITLTRLPPGDTAGVEVESRLIDDRSGRETLAMPRAELGAINVREVTVETAVMADGDEDATIAVSSALRAVAGLSSTTAYVSDAAAPSMAAVWGPIDILVLGRETPQLDPAQMEAIRQWLVGGGRLWINLQRVDPDFARRLLPGDWNVTVLDTVELTDFHIEGGEARGQRAADEADPYHIQVDYPYQMVRVAAPDMEPIHTIGGYPASMRKKVGHGELLVTTLEASAWLTADEKATAALRDLTWLARRDALAGPVVADSETDVTPVLELMAREQIGSTVLSRGPVMLVLGVFALALLAGGLMLAQRGGLAHLGWMAPVLAVGAAIVLLALGLLRQSEDPFTLAASQWVEVAAGQPYARVESLVSVYNPLFSAPHSDAQLRGDGVPAWPDLSAQGGKVIRLLWADEQTWTYPNLDFSEGAIQTASRTTVVPLSGPIAAVVRLGEDELAGQVVAPGVSGIEDAIIVTPSGKLPPKLSEDGRFTAPVADPLAPDQFFSAGLLGQRQMARQEVYRRLLERPNFPAQPMLLGWSEGVDLGVTVSSDAQRRSTALIAIPLRIEAPSPGERVSVPSALLTMSPFRDPTHRYSGAPVYDQRNGEWVQSIQQSQTVLMQFQLPDGLRGMNVDAATIRFTLEAPGRPYAVVVFDGGQVREVASGDSPSGTRSVEVSGPDAPPVNQQGAVVVGLRIGDPADPLSDASWSLSHLSVSVTGTMPASSASGGHTADRAAAPVSTLTLIDPRHSHE